ncbi:MAG: HD domain-containing protein [Proteobacteria bacterium]|nr:HD domain-containing protein [Pseudomonadota bacterium]
MAESIVFVDDEISVLKALKRLLIDEPYEILIFNSPLEALKKIEKTPPAVVISDQCMPEMEGTRFLKKVRDISPETVRIILTGYADAEAAIDAINQGSVFRFVSKPWEDDMLKLTIRQAVEHYKLVAENKRLFQLTQEQNQELRSLNHNLETRVEERTRQLGQSTEKLKHTLSKLQNTLEATIHAIAMTVEIRDPYTAGHQRRVSNLAGAIAVEMGLSQDQIEAVRMAGIIHDLGKISVPAEILSRPGRLTAIEFSFIKMHPEVGCDILKDIEFSWPIAQIVLQHHERIDGSGYPQGLSGEETLIEAKIIAVADVVEAMASHRPYRPALGVQKALEEISSQKGMLYDTKAVDACLKLFQEKGFELQ